LDKIKLEVWFIVRIFMVLKNQYMSYQETTSTHLRDILNNGVVRFQFRKRDGSIRNALGTRNVDLIPKDEYVKHVDDINEKKSVVFWDLEARDFRSLMTGVEVAVM
jgi:hypothetical protein